MGESRSVCRQARRDLGEAATYGRAAARGPDAVTCHPKTAAIQTDDMSIGSWALGLKLLARSVLVHVFAVFTRYGKRALIYRAYSHGDISNGAPLPPRAKF